MRGATYRTGEPCKKCGTDERYISNRRCKHCTTIVAKRSHLKKKIKKQGGMSASDRFEKTLLEKWGEDRTMPVPDAPRFAKSPPRVRTHSGEKVNMDPIIMLGLQNAGRYTDVREK